MSAAHEGIMSHPAVRFMLRILGSTRRLCDRVSRRDLLRAGGLGLCAAGLGQTALTSSAAPIVIDPTFGRAKRVILLYLYGAAAQHETFDLKPEAPAEIGGKFRPIATRIPGLQICEHLPRLAQMTDKVSIVRSMTHPYNIHSAAYTLSGIDKVDIPLELNPNDSRNWPFFGSVLDYLLQRREPAAAPPEVPRNVALPFPFSSRSPQYQRAGPYGGFLGHAFDPVWTEFEGEGTRNIARWDGGANVDQQWADPFVSIAPESRFLVSKAAQMQPEITLDRLNRRRTLLAQLDDVRRDLDSALTSSGQQRFQSMAWSLMTSSKLREALDISRETRQRRERYGMTLFGQATLAGRRLLEAGAPVVTVVWDEFGLANTAWDTHFDHYDRLQHELLPGLDHALTALLADLDERGMLDETLVMCLTEHGRTPKLTLSARGVGREHWSNAYCNLLAGGGIAPGKVIGRSDKQGAFVDDEPISPKDILCTMYHLLGVEAHQMLPDKLGRPLPLVAEGTVVRTLLG